MMDSITYEDEGLKKDMSEGMVAQVRHARA
jgi:hypothetical protein